MIIKATFVVALVLLWSAINSRATRSPWSRLRSRANIRVARASSFAAGWLRSASNARTSLKFILVILAILGPISFLLIQQSTKAAQVGEPATPAGGKILIAGGYSTSMDGFTATTELFDPVSGTFAPANQTASMNSSREEATASLLTSGPDSGDVLIAGGAGLETVTILASTELYNSATNTFAPANETASMNAARGSATATALTTGPNAGKILIAGGANAVDSLASTELYNPATNSFAPPGETASMNVARYGATANVITIGPNAGDILIAAGANNIDSLGSTELYEPAANTFAAAADNGNDELRALWGDCHHAYQRTERGKDLFAGGFAAAPLWHPWLQLSCTIR